METGVMSEVGGGGGGAVRRGSLGLSPPLQTKACQYAPELASHCRGPLLSLLQMRGCKRALAARVPPAGPPPRCFEGHAHLEAAPHARRKAQGVLQRRAVPRRFRVEAEPPQRADGRGCKDERRDDPPLAPVIIRPVAAAQVFQGTQRWQPHGHRRHKAVVLRDVVVVVWEPRRGGEGGTPCLAPGLSTPQYQSAHCPPRPLPAAVLSRRGPSGRWPVAHLGA
jgi:hypothetical protein